MLHPRSRRRYRPCVRCLQNGRHSGSGYQPRALSCRLRGSLACRTRSYRPRTRVPRPSACASGCGWRRGGVRLRPCRDGGVSTRPGSRYTLLRPCRSGRCGRRRVPGGTGRWPHGGGRLSPRVSRPIRDRSFPGSIRRTRGCSCRSRVAICSSNIFFICGSHRSFASKDTNLSQIISLRVSFSSSIHSFALLLRPQIEGYGKKDGRTTTDAPH